METSKNTTSKEFNKAVAIFGKHLLENISLFMVMFYQTMGSLRDFPIDKMSVIDLINSYNIAKQKKLRDFIIEEIQKRIVAMGGVDNFPTKQMSILDLVDMYNISKQKKLKDIIFEEIKNRILQAKKIEEELKVVILIKNKDKLTIEDVEFLVNFGKNVYEVVESSKGFRSGFPDHKFDIYCSSIFSNYKTLELINVEDVVASNVFNDKGIETIQRRLHESMISSLLSVCVLAKNNSMLQKTILELVIENFVIESDMGTFLYQGLVHSNKNSSIHKKMFELFKEFSKDDKNAFDHFLFICKCKICNFFSKEEIDYAYGYVKSKADSFIDLFDVFEVSIEVKKDEVEENYYKCIEKAKHHHEFKRLLDHCKRFSTKTQEIVINGTNSSANSVFEKMNVLSFLFYDNKMEEFNKVFVEFRSMIKTIQDFKNAYFLIDKMEELSKRYINELVSHLDESVSTNQT